MSAPLGGCAPATPTKVKNLSMKENRKDSAPSRWSGQTSYSKQDEARSLLKLSTKG